MYERSSHNSFLAKLKLAPDTNVICLYAAAQRGIGTSLNAKRARARARLPVWQLSVRRAPGRHAPFFFFFRRGSKNRFEVIFDDGLDC